MNDLAKGRSVGRGIREVSQRRRSLRDHKKYSLAPLLSRFPLSNHTVHSKSRVQRKRKKGKGDEEKEEG